MKKKLLLTLLVMGGVGSVTISQAAAAAADDGWEESLGATREELDFAQINAQEKSKGNKPEHGPQAVKTLYNNSNAPIYIGFYVANNRFYPWLEDGKTLAKEAILAVNPGQTVTFVPPRYSGLMGTYYATLVISRSDKDLKLTLQARQKNLIGLNNSDYEIVIAGQVSPLITVFYDEARSENNKFFYSNSLQGSRDLEEKEGASGVGAGASGVAAGASEVAGASGGKNDAQRLAERRAEWLKPKSNPARAARAAAAAEESRSVEPNKKLIVAREADEKRPKDDLDREFERDLQALRKGELKKGTFQRKYHPDKHFSETIESQARYANYWNKSLPYF